MIQWGEKEWFEEQFKNINDRLGDKWGHRWRSSQKFRFKISLNIINKSVVEKDNQSILDIGCALGDFTSQLLNLNTTNHIIGIDISKSAINIVAEQYPEIQFLEGSLPILNFENSYFDIITCLEVLYYLNEDERNLAIKNLNRILKLGGKLFITVVLDNGERYFEKNQFINMISKYFYIEQIEYNYAKLYTKIEARLLIIKNNLESFNKIIILNDDDFIKWCNSKKHSNKIIKVKKIKNFLKLNKWLTKIVTACINLILKIIYLILTKQWIAEVFFYITKLLYKEKGKTQIFILARKR